MAPPFQAVSRYFFAFLLLFAGIIGTGTALSAAERPKIGLVLGGGGAKGAAHIGVIRILEENHIPVDYVGGTSMGAIIGSFYAAGYSADEIEVIARTIDWNHLFKDRPSRSHLNFRRKEQDGDLMTDFRVSFRDGKLILPEGLIHGQKLFLELSRHLLRARLTDDFDQLPIPFRAVAGDLETGEAVVLDHGDIVQSVFASMAVPGMIPPVEIEDHVLVDGGIANNLPVNIVRGMGADIVIVVDVGSAAKSREQISNVFDVMQQISTLMGAASTRAQLESLGPQDVLIHPEIEGMSMASFDRVEEAIDLGIKAGRQAVPRLAALAMDDAAWAAHIAARRARIAHEPVVDFVEVHQDSPLSDNAIKRMVTIAPGKRLDVDVLRENIDNLYGLDTFSRISYSMQTGERGTGLTLEAEQNPAKENYLQFGMAMKTDFDADTSFQLGAGYTMRNINRFGGEWRTLAQVGNNIELTSDFYQPFGPGLKFFVNPVVDVLRVRSPYFGGQARPKGEIRLQAVEVGMDVGMQLGHWGAVRVGQRNSWGNFKPLVGELGFEKLNYADSYAFARLDIDTLDRLSFPRDGIIGAAIFADHKGPFGGDFNMQVFGVAALGVKSYGDNTFMLSGALQTTLEYDPNALGGFSLGGFLNLSGLADGQIGGRHSVFARAVYYRRLTQEGPFLNLPLYLGGSLESGNAYDRLSDWSFGSMIWAGSLFVGADTPIGPIFFGAGVTEHGDNSLYLEIGQTF
ncbi:MAG: hypothetical protein EP335_05540 [Alphaproteobacteria bacterium]|nr:MAG: hypothetical protein EP335_05540 [Alphaproteobacteria bacterium]